jgi:hypothetical protein
MRFNLSVCTTLVLAAVASVAQAGSMTTTLVPAVRYSDATFATQLPFTTTGGAVDPGQPGVYQVDIKFTATPAAGEKGWANTLFNAAVANAGGSNLALDLATGYAPNAGTLDINGGAPGGVTPIYGTNTDAGAPSDLQGILASIASATIATTANDTRNLLGQAGAPANAGFPSLIGSIFVSWNGQGQGALSLGGQQFSFTLDNNTFGSTQAGAGASLAFGVPEPATVSLFGLALVGLVGFARRRG